MLRLFCCFADGRHEWRGSPEAIAAAKSYLSQHARGLAGTFASLGEKGAVADTWRARGGSSRIVQVNGENRADYVSDLCQPAVLVVEDVDADGGFVRVVARVFSAERVLPALRKGWLDIRHGGGEALSRVAASAAREFRGLVRVVAVRDSDRLIPRQRTPKHDDP